MSSFSLIEAIGNRTDVAVLQEAIENGLADVNEKDQNGFSVLVYAIEWSLNDFATYLIEKGAELNATTFYVACLTWNYGQIKLHLDKGLSPNEGFQGYMPLHTVLAASDRLRNSPKYADLEKIVQLLIENQADIHLKNADLAQTPLHFAAYYGEHNLVAKLLEVGAEITVVDKNGFNPLHQTCIGGYSSFVIQQLIHAGANPNVQDSYHGQTALHLAVLHYNYDAVCVLKHLQADKSIGLTTPLPFYNQDPYFDVVFPVGTTPLDIARTLQMYEIADVLDF